jgi:predicted secreted Zn-dependent protease
MKKSLGGKVFLRLVFFAFLAAAALFFAGVNGEAQEGKKKVENRKAYKLYGQKCLGCHDSVADPERPGKTRDDWHLVIEVMHKNGVKLKMAESELLIDYLYNLRKGIEKEAG